MEQTKYYKHKKQINDDGQTWTLMEPTRVWWRYVLFTGFGFLLGVLASGGINV